MKKARKTTRNAENPKIPKNLENLKKSRNLVNPKSKKTLENAQNPHISQNPKIPQNPSKIKSIKIIGGIFKGAILEAGIFHTTRPTKAIVKESLFNTLGQKIYDKTFLEVFAGYGSIGFEALSRGAKNVIFIEKDKNIFEILQKNVALFSSRISKNAQNTHDTRNLKSQIPQIPQNQQNLNPRTLNENHENIAKIEAYNQDSLIFLPQLLKNKNIDILYFDPPFGEKYYQDCVDILQNFSLCDKMVIFEHASQIALPPRISNLSLAKTRRFGKSSISYYC